MLTYLICLPTCYKYICHAGYVANFRVDLRDGTSIESMMRQVIEEFGVPGINVYADNLFVTVGQLRWCMQRRVNLAGTTRRGRGFPADLDFDGMELGDWDWRMTNDGLLAVAWRDVGQTKAMYVSWCICSLC